MTPQEKARELYDKFYPLSESAVIEIVWGDTETSINENVKIKNAKRCAHIAVDEIIESEPFDPFYGDYYETIDDRLNYVAAYWHQVKEEINKL